MPALTNNTPTPNNNILYITFKPDNKYRDKQNVNTNLFIYFKTAITDIQNASKFILIWRPYNAVF